jgi:hypothetical protein
MRTIIVTGKPRHDDPEFVPGRVGFENFGSPGIAVIGRSVSFTTSRVLNNNATGIGTVVHTVVMEDGTTVSMPGRFIRKIGYVYATIDQGGRIARWAS